MKRHKICKIILAILAVFLCVAFYELIGICITYKKQPAVSDATIKETQNIMSVAGRENTERAVIIEKNSQALLERVRLIQNAKDEIILSTFAFKSDESGKLILGALHGAADRGVHVRILVDGMVWRVIHIFMDYLRMRMLRLSCIIKQIRLSHGRQWEECMINI